MISYFYLFNFLLIFNSPVLSVFLFDCCPSTYRMYPYTATFLLDLLTVQCDEVILTEILAGSEEQSVRPENLQTHIHTLKLSQKQDLPFLEGTCVPISAQLLQLIDWARSKWNLDHELRHFRPPASLAVSPVPGALSLHESRGELQLAGHARPPLPRGKPQ